MPKPRRTATRFPHAYEIGSTYRRGRAEIENGDLLRLAARAEFDALVTCDKKRVGQQNHDALPISVIAVDTGDRKRSFRTFSPLVPKIVDPLEQLGGPAFVIVQPTDPNRVGGAG